MKVTLTACEGTASRCAFCHDDAHEELLVCPGCSTRVHHDCCADGACPTLGCAERAWRDPTPAAVRRSRWPILRRLLVLGGLAALVLVSVSGPGPSPVSPLRADLPAISEALAALPIDRGDGARFGASYEIVSDASLPWRPLASATGAAARAPRAPGLADAGSWARAGRRGSQRRSRRPCSRARPRGASRRPRRRTCRREPRARVGSRRST